MLLILPLLLVASAFFSGSETALFSLSAKARLDLARSKTLVARNITQLLSETRSLLITILLGNMTVNVLYFVISTVLLIRLTDPDIHGLALTAAITSVLAWLPGGDPSQTYVDTVSGIIVSALSILPLVMVILLGEVFPKLVATRMALRWSQIIAIPLMLVHRTITPLRLVLNAVVITPLARLIAPSTKPVELSPDEMATLLELSHEQGVIHAEEEQLLQGVLSLSQLQVEDLMVPRVDLTGYDMNAPLNELGEIATRSQAEDIVVYRESMDHFEGLLPVEAVLRQPPRNRRDLQRLMVQPLVVPEISTADQVLRQFRESGNSVAIAVDEYGGTAGLITLDQIVDAMMRDLGDSPEDTQVPDIERLGPTRWRLSGRLPVSAWVESLGLGQSPLGVTTMSGLVTSMLGRLAKEGDEVELAYAKLRVEEVEGRRISRLLLEMKTDEKSGVKEQRGATGDDEGNQP